MNRAITNVWECLCCLLPRQTGSGTAPTAPTELTLYPLDGVGCKPSSLVLPPGSGSVSWRTLAVSSGCEVHHRPRAAFSFPPRGVLYKLYESLSMVRSLRMVLRTMKSSCLEWHWNLCTNRWCLSVQCPLKAQYRWYFTSPAHTGQASCSCLAYIYIFARPHFTFIIIGCWITET